MISHVHGRAPKSIFHGRILIIIYEGLIILMIIIVTMMIIITTIVLKIIVLFLYLILQFLVLFVYSREEPINVYIIYYSINGEVAVKFERFNLAF